MNTKTLAQTCINAYREVLRQNVDGFGFSLGHDVGMFADSPSRLARVLKARLLNVSTLGTVNWLAVAILVLSEVKAHA
jgi:hypothetical protein